MTEQPGRLQFMGSQRVIYDRVSTDIFFNVKQSKENTKINTLKTVWDIVCVCVCLCVSQK